MRRLGARPLRSSDFAPPPRSVMKLGGGTSLKKRCIGENSAGSKRRTCRGYSEGPTNYPLPTTHGVREHTRFVRIETVTGGTVLGRPPTLRIMRNCVFDTDTV